jgi:hypothetical protein
VPDKDETTTAASSARPVGVACYFSTTAMNLFGSSRPPPGSEWEAALDFRPILICMGRMGDLLELIDAAPVGVRSLSGSLWKWTHHERTRRAIEEMAQRSGTTVSHFGFGGPIGETTDEHIEVRCELPDRWRIESDSRIDVKVGGERWMGSATHVTEVDGDTSSLDDCEVGLFLRPGSRLLGGLRFELPVDDEVAGRPCWKAAATADRIKKIPMFLGLRLGGTDHTLWFDVETGIILRHVGMIDNEPSSIEEFKSITINPHVAEETFRFVAPPGMTVVRQIDQLINMAEMQGVDLQDVDRTDLAAVRNAMSDMMRPHQRAPEAQLERRRAKHIPVGEPPEDEAAARTQIEYAFSHFGDTDETGSALVNVQKGDGLAKPLEEARHRIPGSPPGDVSIVVDDLKFLRSDEAVVWFSVMVDGNRLGMVNGREGRTVLVNHQWVVEQATIVDLLGYAGVVVPPPPDTGS